WCDNRNLVQHFAQRGTLADDVLEVVLRANLRFRIEGFFFQLAHFGKGCSCEASEVRESNSCVPHTLLLNLQACIMIMFLIMGVCGDLGLITTVNRTVVV